jgi:adenosine kinase
MEVIITGALAYDRIFQIDGLLSNLFDRDHHTPMELGFHAREIVERLGGNAGNIAYTLSLFGVKPTILSSIGRDYHRYFKWLNDNHIETDGIRIVDQEMTASAYVIADRKHNRITAFVPAAMEYPSSFDISSINAEETLAIIAAGNISDMKNYCHNFHKSGIPHLFNPGQSLSRWIEDDLIHCIQGAEVVVVNEDELEVVKRKTGFDKKALIESCQAFVITLAKEGSLVYCRDFEKAIPAVIPERLVDTQGAGDAFTGGLAYGITKGKTTLESAIMASVGASFSLEYPGTQEFRFSQEDFNERLDRLVLKMSNK